MRIADLSAPSESVALQESSGREWTYGQLHDAVTRRAATLRASSKSLVFCLCHNRPDTVIDYLAARHAGHAVALFDARLNAELLVRLVDLYQPEFLLDAGQLETRPVASAPALAEELAVLLSTSGTTGSPKLVRLSQGNVMSNALAIAKALEIAPTDRPISSLPIHYSYGLSVLNSHLATGARFVLTEDSMMQNSFWETVRQNECTSFAGVPYLYQMLDRLNLDRLSVPSLRTFTQAGGRLIPALIEKFHGQITERGGNFFVMYGQTEATARISVLPPRDLLRKLGSVGLPLAGGSLSIQEEEVVYTGPNVMQGYAWTREDLSLGDECAGSLRTGDRGHFDDEGFLFIDGRFAREAKLFGLRINLEEVEALLRVHGPTAAIDQENRIIVFCDWGDEDTRAREHLALAAKLNLAARALEFRPLHPLPVTASGKIAYDQLRSVLA